MKKIFLIGFLTLCASLKLSAQKEVIHYNMIFSPDLSNRLNNKLYPKPVNDADIVQGILEKIWPDILRKKRDEGQQDHFSVDFINKGLIGLYKINTSQLNIDFQSFNKQSDRIDYIKHRHNVSNYLEKDIKEFMFEYRKMNTKAAMSNNGADLWTYFQSGIDERIILSPKIEKNVMHKFRNVLVLTTDGYIEAGIYGKGYDLSASKISAFRDAFIKSRTNDLNAFLIKNPKFKINSVKNPYLKNLEVIVLEMYDRSLSKTGAATKHPTDMEIMKAIWADWFRNSGVKRFELKPIAYNKADGIKYVMDFIN